MLKAVRALFCRVETRPLDCSNYRSGETLVSRFTKGGLRLNKLLKQLGLLEVRTFSIEESSNDLVFSAF
jgi:hypothetical protein